MPSRPFRIGRSTTGLALFATKPNQKGRLRRHLSGATYNDRGADRRIARGATYVFEVNSRWTIDGSPRRLALKRHSEHLSGHRGLLIDAIEPGGDRPVPG
jgi:hypothetical protein